MILVHNSPVLGCGTYTQLIKSILNRMAYDMSSSTKEVQKQKPIPKSSLFLLIYNKECSFWCLIQVCELNYCGNIVIAKQGSSVMWTYAVSSSYNWPTFPS